MDISSGIYLQEVEYLPQRVCNILLHLSQTPHTDCVVLHWLQFLNFLLQRKVTVTQ